MSLVDSLYQILRNLGSALTVILEYVNHLLNLRVAHLLDLAVVDAGCAGSQIAFCGFFEVDRSVQRLIESLPTVITPC